MNSNTSPRNRLIRPLKQLYPVEIPTEEEKIEISSTQAPASSVFEADDEIVSVELKNSTNKYVNEN